MSRSQILRSLLFILPFIALVTAQRAGPIPDPFLDPKNDVYNPLRYIASDTLTAIAFSLLTVSTACLAWNTWKYGAKYMLCMVIGGVFFAAGIALRFGLARDPHSRGIYIAEYLFVVLSPCAFLAGVYILLGRLAQHLKAGKYLFLPPHRVTVIFLVSDVVTFLIQAAGGGTSTSRETKVRNLGAKIFTVGLALQLASFAFFTALFVSFLYRIKVNAHDIWTQDDHLPVFRRWKTLAIAMGVSCAGILVRSFFRVIEIGEGWGGHLATTEYYFYALDTLPLFVAISVYIPFWPGRYIDEGNDTLNGDDEERKSDEEVPAQGGLQNGETLVAPHPQEKEPVRNSLVTL